VVSETRSFSEHVIPDLRERDSDGIPESGFS
jgi:hypothetical protein